MKNKGKKLIIMGLLLILAAFFLASYNLYDQWRAQMSSRQAMELLEQWIPEEIPQQPESGGKTKVPGYVLNPEMEMPVKTVNGVDYIGVLRIPKLGLELPVISKWSYPNMKIAPSRYDGSAYTGDLIIAGHNYVSHFGNLETLSAGDAVIFTDMDGNTFTYRVADMEILPATAVEEMEGGDWDLTLFTCTIGGQSRVTVRCEATNV